MIPEDPYGKIGPSLEFILHKLKSDAQIDENYIEISSSTTTAAVTNIPATTTTTTADANSTIILTEDEPSLIVCDN